MFSDYEIWRNFANEKAEARRSKRFAVQFNTEERLSSKQKYFISRQTERRRISHFAPTECVYCVARSGPDMYTTPAAHRKSAPNSQQYHPLYIMNACIAMRSTFKVTFSIHAKYSHPLLLPPPARVKILCDALVYIFAVL